MEEERIPRCSARIRDTFIRDYRHYLEHARFFVRQEVSYRRDLTVVKVHQPVNTRMKIYPQVSSFDPWDMRLTFLTEYSRCTERDLFSGEVRAIPMISRYRVRESRPFHIIFREKVSLPPLIVVQEMKKRRINAICLLDYDGPVLKRAFRDQLMQFEIEVVFIRGLNPLKPASVSSGSSPEHQNT
ncbi:MAG: hypothetical protein IT233_01835 [Bacteroidia bacterium]|nr:hypothetical protein [Bacteroidia bacterium]